MSSLVVGVKTVQQIQEAVAALEVDIPAEHRDKLDEIFSNEPGVQDWLSIGGFSVIDGTNASNAATIWIVMDPWGERADPSLSQGAILASLTQKFR